MRVQKFDDALEDLMHRMKVFAEEHPMVAHSLNLLDKDGPQDPEVRYLLEAFAFMTAELSIQIEKSKNRYSDALNHYTKCIWLNPTPPATVMQISANDTVSTNESLTFGTSEAMVKTFGVLNTMPFKIKSAHYIKGFQCDLQSTWALEIELEAGMAGDWYGGIEIYVMDSVKLVSSIISAGCDGYYQYNDIKNAIKPVLSRENEDLMPYFSHPADCRLHELLTFTEKYCFIGIPIKFWQGQYLKIVLPVNFNREQDLVKLHPYTFRLNCIPAVALETQMIDPIVFNGERSVYEFGILDGWTIYAIKELYFSDPELELNTEFVINDNRITAIISGKAYGVISGTVWAIPKITPCAYDKYQSPQIAVSGELLYSCSDIYHIPSKHITNLWAMHISNNNASAEEYILRFLEYAPVLASKKLVRVIEMIKFVSEEAFPVFIQSGWINGSIVTIKVMDIDAILICRVLFLALKHKAQINTAIGLRIIDDNNTEIISWPPTANESIYRVKR